MNPSRQALWIALLTLVPFVLWLGGLAWPGNASASLAPAGLQQVAETLLLLQGFTLALCVPTWTLGESRSSRQQAILMLVLLPLPVLSILWLMGAASAVGIAGGLMMLYALSTGIAELLAQILPAISRAFPLQAVVVFLQLALGLALLELQASNFIAAGL